MLDLLPTLTGPHIKLRPLAAQDFGELFGVASDPLLWAQHPDPARGTHEGFQLFFEEALNSRGCLVTIDTTRESVIGCSRYTRNLYFASQSNLHYHRVSTADPYLKFTG